MLLVMGFSAKSLAFGIHSGVIRTKTSRALSFCGVSGSNSDSDFEMGYTMLGDLRVSKVCLGTMTWGEQNTVEEGVCISIASEGSI